MALAHSIPDKPRKFLPFKSVLIISDDIDQVASYIPQLQKSGYNTVTSALTGKTLQGIPRQAPDAILLHFSDAVTSTQAITNALRQRYDGKNVPIIGIFSENRTIDNSMFDSVMFAPVEPAQIAHRIGAMMRLNIMQTEIAMRMETLREDFGIDYRLNPKSFKDELKVLFIGKATPEFMIIINALEQKNVEVVAAFTSFTAFDFLHETTFDAVVMNALGGMEPGLSIAQTMRRNSSLYHTPTLLLANKGHVQTSLAFEHGVSDIIYADSDTKDIQDRILELARFHQLHRQVKAEFENLGQAECHDESGAYSNDFFAKHLNRLVDTYTKQDLPVSILTVHSDFIDRRPEDADSVSLVFNQLGHMIKNMVRVYDVTSRLSQKIYVVAFPGQPASTLEPVVKRLSSIQTTTEFGPSKDGRETYQLALNIELTEISQGVTGESWLAQQMVETA